jgi:phage terminase large subunit-like protein
MPFSQPQADAACNFFEGVLKHTADEWYGKPFLLAPWQEEALSAIFGQIDHAGNRVIEMAYLEVPKKAGKSEMAAGLALFVLLTTNTPGCQVYGAAAATRQALNVFRAACKMVDQSAVLAKRLRVLRSTHRITKRSDPESFYAAVAADGDFGDGVNPAVVIADEVHRWKTRKQLDNWDVLSNGGITRRQTLTIAITTAGVQNESPLAWRLHEKARKVEEGIVSDPKFYGRIYGAAKEDDPADPATWIKANPSLIQNGGFLDIEKIREKFVSHLAEGDLTSFKRYYLNMWDQKESRAIDMAKWDASTGDWQAMGLLEKSPDDKVRPLPHVVVQRFQKRRCWAGVDLSMTTDLSAVSLVFPGKDASFEVLPFFWMPELAVRHRELRDGMPYQRWAEQGFIELSPGEVVDYREIVARLEWADQVFDLEEICFDPWNSRQISVPMAEQRYNCIEIRQGVATLSEPSKKVLELVASGKLHHGGHPVLRWNASCVSVKEQNDNLLFTKPERSKSSSRIDGIAATVNALARAIVTKPKQMSIYNKRGILSLDLGTGLVSL